MNNYFNLNSECYLVPGHHRSAVYNLDTGEAIWLNAVQSKTLVLSESKKELTEPALIYDYLAERGWGFYSQKPVFVDKARTINVFGERRIWLQQPQFAVLVAQITDSCNQACENCGRSFCPICFSDNKDGVCLSTAQWLRIIEDASTMGCQSIMFTGGECFLHEGLHQMLELALKLGLDVTIQTNGRSPLADIPAHVGISVLCNPYSDTNLLFKNIRGRQRVTVIFQDVDANDFPDVIEGNWVLRTVSSSEPRKGKDYLHNIKLDAFFYKKLKDPCLNGKMYICADGSVVPCFQKKEYPLGNVECGEFSEIYSDLIKQYWYAPLEQRTRSMKCHSCELIYACPVCRFSNVGDSCNYEPLE